MIGEVPRSEEFVDLRDLVNALLAAAVGISHSLLLLHKLSAQAAGANELAELDPIAEAITLLIAARQRLIGDADRLSDLISGT